jgi:two-component system, sensor histidine kinase SagS
LVTEPRSFLVVREPGTAAAPAIGSGTSAARTTEAASLTEAAALLAAQPFDGLLVMNGSGDDRGRLEGLSLGLQILQRLPDGVAILDVDRRIQWANERLVSWCGRGQLTGCDLIAALGAPDILGRESAPFESASTGGQTSSATLRTADNRYFHVLATPLAATGDPANGRLIVSVRDVTDAILEQQKRAAIHQAGQKLADLSPAELADMTIEERIELLKSNILHYSKDLLQFDVVEIRLLDQQTGRLEPLLAEGMQPEAEARILYARPENNGVTGYVAATGKSYFCNDTTKDPLYLEGCKGAKSSLTVPLMLHEQVIGTFNVESPEPGGFTDTDLQFLEIFSRDVAAALNTLELLVAEKASTAAESIEAIHGAVALPVDDILNDAVNVMERYIGHDADVVDRLQRILRNARDIKQVIQKVGEKMTPSSAHAQLRQGEQRRSLNKRRILVVDADEQVRAAAHSLLERYGCTVETARDGSEAASMVRACCDESYDVILADIRLPDMSGYELLVKLQQLLETVPLVLMTGFGYDPGHSIVKARQAGVDLVLFKPFRIDQLLDTVEKAVVKKPALSRDAAAAALTAAKPGQG